MSAEASSDGTSTAWDKRDLKGHTGYVFGCAFSPNGALLATTSNDKTARLWDVATGQETRKLEVHTEYVLGCAFSPNGALLATTSYDKTARLWDVTTGQETRKLEGHTGYVTGCAFSPNGALLATTSSDNTARLWDVATGQETRKLEGHTNYLTGCAFSPNGALLATTSADKTARLWDVATGQETRKLEGHTNYLTGCAFSPDGALLATTSDDKTARLWDVTTGQETRKLEGHTGYVTGCAFSPNGALLATTSADKTARLWDVTTGQETHKLEGHTNAVFGCAFSPDGALLATASRDKTAALWSNPAVLTETQRPDGAAEREASLRATGGIADVPKGVDRLGYTIYAKALAETARKAESPTASLAVGLYARWGGGKSFLWQLVKHFLEAEVLVRNARKLLHQARVPPDNGARAAFERALEAVQKNPYVDQHAKTTLTNDAQKARLLPKLPKTPSKKAEQGRGEPFVYHLLIIIDAVGEVFRCSRVGAVFRRCCGAGKAKEDAADATEKERLLGAEEGVKQQKKEYLDRARRVRSDESRAALLVLLFPLVLLPALVHACWDRRRKRRGASVAPLHADSEGRGTARKTRAEDAREPSAEEARKTRAEEARRVRALLTGQGELADDDPDASWFSHVVDVARVMLMHMAHGALALAEPILSWASGLLQWLRAAFCCGEEQAHAEPASVPPECLPEGETGYISVDFNAWVFAGSDMLWASLVKEIYDAVELEFGKDAVRKHRVRCALSDETPKDSREEKQRKRSVALRRHQAVAQNRLIMGAVLATALWFGVEQLLRVVLCPSDDGDAEPIKEFCTCADPTTSLMDTTNSTDVIGACLPPLAEAVPSLMATLLPSALVGLYPVARQIYLHFTQVRPYLRQSQGARLAEEARKTSKRADMSAELGFMDEVRKEIEFLYDFLRTTYLVDKENGTRRLMRLLVFIDDLDRCPKHVVVSVLESVILLLVEAPITCWLAIDSRVVATSIEDHYGEVFSKAGISGYEFLEKIVQLPFCLPNLANDKKAGYLNKMVEEEELEPRRVLDRVNKNMVASSRMPSFAAWIDAEAVSKDQVLPALSSVAHEMMRLSNNELFRDPPDRQAERGMNAEQLLGTLKGANDSKEVRSDLRESFLYGLSEDARDAKERERKKETSKAEEATAGEAALRQVGEKAAESESSPAEGAAGNSQPQGDGQRARAGATQESRSASVWRKPLAKPEVLGRTIVLHRDASNGDLARGALRWDDSDFRGYRKGLKGHTELVYGCAFSPNGALLATTSDDKTARLWDVATGKETRKLEGHTDRVYGCAFSPNGALLATTSDDKTARLWDVTTGKETRKLEGHTGFVTGCAFSPNGALLATTSYDNTARLWDVTTGQETHKLKGHTELVYGCAFSPDGALLATTSADKTARLWDVATGQETRKLEGHTGPVLGCAFSPNGALLATTSRDSIARLWDVATGKETHKLVGHTDAVFGCAFSPDGALLATTSYDKTARLWDVATGQETRKLEGHTDAVFGCAFSPNGALLATTSEDKTAALWSLSKDPHISLKPNSTAASHLITVAGKSYGIASEAAAALSKRADDAWTPPWLPAGSSAEAVLDLELELDEAGNKLFHLELKKPAAGSAVVPFELSLKREGKDGKEDGRQLVEAKVELTVRSKSDKVDLGKIALIIPPPAELLPSTASSYKPMLDDLEKEALHKFNPFLEGNPRKLKRIINCFNVTRSIADMRIGQAVTDAEREKQGVFQQKLLKLTILTEQWPYRMGWLMQFIEDMQQQHDMYDGVDPQASGDEGTAAQHLLKYAQEEQGARLDHVLGSQLLANHQSVDISAEQWEDLLATPAVVVYKSMVHGLIYAPHEAHRFLNLDGDPQNFERLLLTEPIFSVKDLLVNNSAVGDEWMLSRYAFSMNPGVLAKIAQFMDELALGDGNASTQYTRKKQLYDRREPRPGSGRREPTPRDSRATTDVAADLKDGPVHLLMEAPAPNTSPKTPSSAARAPAATPAAAPAAAPAAVIAAASAVAPLDPMEA